MQMDCREHICINRLELQNRGLTDLNMQTTDEIMVLAIMRKDYPRVIAMSADAEALLAAWNKDISADQAREVVYDYLDEQEVPILDFTATTHRGMAWPGGRIRLPESPSLGLVLHEVAHIIQFNDRHDRGHGKGFVKILDGLVRSESLQGRF